MNALTTPPLLTTDDLLTMPDDGTERWLIDGQLRERWSRGADGQSRGCDTTVRNRFHSRIMIRVGKFLDNWLDDQPEPRGQVLCGEVGVRLRRDPDTTVGADVISRQTDETTLVDGVPVLAVEILSPNDVLEEIHEKIDAYLRAGVALVWIINPYDRTVSVYRPGEEPVLINVRQELSAEPQLPGFRVPVARLFE